MKKIAEYWRYTCDWRKQEDELNKFSKFKTTIEGIDIHFLRVTPKSGRQGKTIFPHAVFITIMYQVVIYKNDNTTQQWLFN